MGGIGELKLFRAAGSDIRWSAAGGYNATHARTPIEDATDLVVAGKMTFWGTMPAFTTAGLFLLRRIGGDALWFGAHFEGGVHKIGWRATVNGVAGAINVLVTPATNAPYYLRVRKAADVGPTHWTLEYSTSGFEAMTATTVNAGIADPDYAGFGATTTLSSIGSDLTVNFDDFSARVPRGRRGWHWYAYRDPGLPGTADLVGANVTVRTLKPAHTHAYAISSRSLLCDSDSSVCDGGPMGGL